MIDKGLIDDRGQGELQQSMLFDDSAGLGIIHLL